MSGDGQVTVQMVFGVSKEPVLSYYEREAVDEAFDQALKSTKQIVIYGSSKQGKSALLDKHVDPKDRVTVHCSPNSSTEDIYKSFLRQLGVTLQSESVIKESDTKKSSLGGKVRAFLPGIANAEVSTSLDESNFKEKSEVSDYIEFNLGLAQDVGEVLSRLPRKFYVLENFHYLDEEAQRTLAFDLRTFEGMGIRFIVLGVWKESNRLEQYCGDLQDRVAEVPVEPWLEEDFKSVIKLGSEKLNIAFSSIIIDGVVSKSHGSIGVAQELLKKICFNAGILKKLPIKFS